MNLSSQYPRRRRLTRAEARRRRRNRAIRRVADLTLVACVLVGGVAFLLHRKAPVPAASAASALPAASSTAASEAATNGLFGKNEAASSAVSSEPAAPDNALGLTAEEAAARLDRHGPNKLQEAPKATLLQRFFQQLKDPMLLILMAAAAVSAATNALSGESFTEVFIILAVVLLNAVLGVVQESKAEAAIEALQTMTAAKCKVLRGGEHLVLESSRLVPGDVVLLEAGDAVPADGRLLESASLKIEEAALTGESVPVTKAIEAITGAAPLGDRKHMC